MLIAIVVNTIAGALLQQDFQLACYICSDLAGWVTLYKNDNKNFLLHPRASWRQPDSEYKSMQSYFTPLSSVTGSHIFAPLAWNSTKAKTAHYISDVKFLLNHKLTLSICDFFPIFRVWIQMRGLKKKKEKPSSSSSSKSKPLTAT